MDDYNLDQWSITRRCELVKKLNSSLKKVEDKTGLELPKAYLNGNYVCLHIMYFKNFMYKLLHRIKQEL